MKKIASQALTQAANDPFKIKKRADKEIPTLTGYELQADQLRLAIAAAQEAKDSIAEGRAALLPAIREEYLKRAASGDFVKSLNVPGQLTPGLQVTWSDEFYEVDVKYEAKLRELDPKFDEHFEQKRSIALKRTDVEMLKKLIKKLGPAMSDIFDVKLKKTDDATIEMLVEKLGREDFVGIFNVNLSLIARPDLDRRLHEVPEEARTIARQHEASVKLLGK